MKRLAIASLVLSLLFAGLIFARWTRESPVVPTPSSGPSPVLAASPDRTITNVVTLVRTNTPAPTPPEFHWSQLESTNYVAYRDNLRDFGCPEWLVRQIIFRDLVAQTRLANVEVEHVYPDWKTADEVLELERNLARQSYRNDLLVGQTMEELFDSFWLPEGFHGWLGRGNELAVFAGFLPPKHAIELFSRLSELSKHKRLVERETWGVLLDSDRQSINENLHRTMAMLRGTLGDGATDELKARMGAMLAITKGGGGLKPKYLDMNATQFRELGRVVYDVIDPAHLELVADGDPEDAFVDRREELLAAIGSSMGESMVRRVLRASDPAFRAAADFASKHQLRSSTRNALYETRKALAEEFRSLEGRSDLSPADVTTMTEVLIETTLRELSKVMSPNLAEQFLTGSNVAKPNREEAP